MFAPAFPMRYLPTLYVCYGKFSFGDSGTGKSETGAHIAYALAMSNRIKENNGCVLYTAPTNKAVDVVMSKLSTMFWNCVCVCMVSSKTNTNVTVHLHLM